MPKSACGTSPFAQLYWDFVSPFRPEMRYMETDLHQTMSIRDLQFRCVVYVAGTSTTFGSERDINFLLRDINGAIVSMTGSELRE